MNDKPLVNDKQKLSECHSQVVIRQIEDKAEKLKYMQICDSAYTISVLKSDNFGELFEKIHQNAIFLGLKYNSQLAGYVAFYANNMENKVAFITLICIADGFQRLHLGTMLMDECIKMSKEIGMEQIELEVLRQDINAICFYKHYDFVEEKMVSDKSLYMKKKLFE